MRTKTLSFKFTANNKGIIAYYAWLMCNVLPISVKKFPFIQQNFQEVFTHTSNFIITAILMSVVSLIWLLQGAPYKYVVYLGLIAIVLNFLIELFVNILNTPDIVDAVYGSASVLMTTLVMFLLKEIGLKKIVS